MINLDFLRDTLIISTILGTITCTFVQKTKRLFSSSNYLTLYSFLINIIFGILFSYTFTNLCFPQNLWIGLFSFIGSDSIYKKLEGKIASFTDLTTKYPQQSVDKDI